MKKHLLVLGMASLLSLTGCHGTKKVDFKTFGEKVEEVAKKEIKIKSVKVSGKVEGEKFKAFTVVLEEKTTPELDENQSKAYYAVGGLYSVTALYSSLAAGYAIYGDKAVEGYTFYTGNGFKIAMEQEVEGKKSSMSVEYDKKGIMTSLKGESDGKKSNISVSYKLDK